MLVRFTDRYGSPVWVNPEEVQMVKSVDDEGDNERSEIHFYIGDADSMIKVSQGPDEVAKVIQRGIDEEARRAVGIMQVNYRSTPEVDDARGE